MSSERRTPTRLRSFSVSLGDGSCCDPFCVVLEQCHDIFRRRFVASIDNLLVDTCVSVCDFLCGADMAVLEGNAVRDTKPMPDRIFGCDAFGDRFHRKLHADIMIEKTRTLLLATLSWEIIVPGPRGKLRLPETTAWEGNVESSVPNTAFY